MRAGFLVVQRTDPVSVQAGVSNYQGLYRMPPWSQTAHEHGFADPLVFESHTDEFGLIPDLATAQLVRRRFVEWSPQDDLEILWAMDPFVPGIDTSTYEFLGIDAACKAPFWSILVDVPGEDLQRVADQLNDRGLFKHVTDADRYLVTYRNSHPEASSLHLFLWAVYRVDEHAVTNRSQPLPGGSNHKRVALAADLLERVASGEMEPSAALKEWPGSPEADALLDASWHDLSHFAIDADIRAKDPQYARYQVSLLLKRAKEIREKYPAP